MPKRKMQQPQQQNESASPDDTGSVAAAGNNLNPQTPDAHFRDHLGVFNSRGAPSSVSGASPSPGAALEAPQVSGPPAHGFANGATSPTSDALGQPVDPEAHIHPDLRARVPFAPALNMMPAGMQGPTAGSPGVPNAGPSMPPQSQPPQQPPQQQQPQPAQQPQSAQPEPIADPMAIDEMPPDGRKAKRELSQSKRAAQNRAAQRAFRQRKEGYIKKLEQQVRDYGDMEQSFKQLQSENYALREYVIHLQSRLLDAQGEYPQPPPNVNLSQPPTAAPDTQGPPNAPVTQSVQPAPSISSEPAPGNAAAGTPLEAVAQAVAGLAAHDQMAERQQYAGKEYRPEPQKEEDARETDDIEEQLRQEGMSAPTAAM